MLRYFFVFALVISFNSLFAQDYAKDFEIEFFWQVKQVDQFIDRFNNNDSTIIKQYVKSNSTKQITRQQLIMSLFNAEKKNWNVPEVKSFVKAVDNKKKPQLLDLYGEKWDALVICAVNWNGKTETADLTLKLIKLPNGACKWIITDVRAQFLKTITYNTLFRVPAAVDSTTSLNPVSHTTDFMAIDQVSEDKTNIANYFLKAEEYPNETTPFIRECLNGHLRIVQANSVRYQFNQVAGWVFEIQQFNRQSKNSGWLISKLTKTSSD